MSDFRPPGPLRTPVLFIAFNRYEPARKVMEAIRQARPPRLYFACDGPRNEAERAVCAKVRSLVEHVDWPCELLTRFSDTNLGVKSGESQAMDWFFGHEEEGIVLEDDVLPLQSFFWYCEELLERYRHDERIWCIMGNNLMTEWHNVGLDAYWFSAHGYGAYWGWAGWKRVWKHYDVNMLCWPEVRASGVLDGHFLSRGERSEVLKLMDYTYLGRIRSWDYQFDLGRMLNHGLAIIPNRNLIRNIGFGAAGTHTVDVNDKRNKDADWDIQLPLVHPKHIIPDGGRDRAYFEAYIRPSRWRRMKYLVKRLTNPLLSRDLSNGPAGMSGG